MVLDVDGHAPVGRVEDWVPRGRPTTSVRRRSRGESRSAGAWPDGVGRQSADLQVAADLAHLAGGFRRLAEVTFAVVPVERHDRVRLDVS